MARARPAQRAARTSALRIGRGIGEYLESQRLQRVAGENRRRFVEGAVGRWAPAPQVVVVHRRQIVVDQRIGVNAFDRDACAPRTLVGASKRPRRLDSEEGPEPLAAAERRIAHRRDEARGTRRLAGPGLDAKQIFELALDCGPGFGEPGRKRALVH